MNGSEKTCATCVWMFRWASMRFRSVSDGICRWSHAQGRQGRFVRLEDGCSDWRSKMAPGESPEVFDVPTNKTKPKQESENG